MDSSSDTDTDIDSSLDISVLFTEINKIANTAEILQSRVDTIRNMIEQEEFSLQDHMIQPFGTNLKAVCDLLFQINLSKDTFTVGEFLTSLNRWLVRTGQVDLNDLLIVPNEVTRNAFGISVPTKLAYAQLLFALPQMFRDA
jgi:hypothetical protein